MKAILRDDAKVRKVAPACLRDLAPVWLVTKLATSKVSHATVFSAAVWFTATAIARHTFLAPYPTCHRLIFVPNLATSAASILLATLFVAATVCRRLGVATLALQESQLPSAPSLAVHVMCPRQSKSSPA